MSCDGCGCCAKCGCRATCTCNRNDFFLESEAEFSFTMVGETNCVALEGAHLACFPAAPGVNGGECVSCGKRAPGN